MRRIEALDALKALLVLMVVAIHAARPDTVPDPEWRRWILIIVSTIAVPGFFWIDGYLFGDKLDRPGSTSIARTFRDSWRRLLVPWLIFSLTYLVVRAALAGAELIESVRSPEAPWSMASIANSIWYSQAATQLYFLPTLFLVRMLANAGATLIQAISPGILLAFSLFLGLIFHVWLGPWYQDVFQPPGEDPIHHVPWALGFFLLGTACRRLSLAKFTASRFAALAIAAAAGAAFAQGSNAAWFVFQISYLMLAIWLISQARRLPAWLLAVGRRTMGIYLLHAPLMIVAARKFWIEWLDLPGNLAYFLVVATAFSAALLLTMLIERSGLSGVLFGERSVAQRGRQSDVSHT